MKPQSVLLRKISDSCVHYEAFAQELLSKTEARRRLGLAAPELSAANQDYLRRNPRGWMARFRNTDDAFIYQLEWLNNSYFQSLYTDQAPQDSVRRSFEWLLLQALPDGTPLRYNHLGFASLAGISYLGARLMDDPRYVWLAGRALDYAEAQGQYLFAQPGVEEPLASPGQSPTESSCLLYGDSGLPNQIGPLAPDKISLRNGWSREATNLLLNLRFTGWHRYKATNTITLLHHGTPLAADVLDGAPFRWLPVGRSVFRDKRIPRENLNGLLVERTGMSSVLYHLTGIGGPWAQDPQYSAEVVSFETDDERDWSHTRLVDWRGWQHDRWIRFYHDGDLVIVADSAHGPKGNQAALMWHLVGQGTEADQRIQLGAGEELVEVLLWPIEQEGQIDITEETSGGAGTRVAFQSTEGGDLQAITFFLMGRWAGSEVEFDEDQQVLLIPKGNLQTTVEVPFNE